MGTLTVTGQSATEGAPIIFQLELSDPVPAGTTLFVSYAFVGGTATVGEDFQDFGVGTAIFAAGSRSATISLPTISDLKFEPDESVALHINSASDPTLTLPADTTAFILNDDPQGPAPMTMSVTHDGVSAAVIVQAYTGPVAGLQWQYIGDARPEVVLGTSGNDFINVGAGTDAVNGGAGDDVIDGGTGSNYLIGGTGHDTFFLDGRSGEVTWSTIVDWEAGEQLSVWGWKPGVSKATWVTDAGSPGHTGVTMHADLNGDGLIDTSVTWEGKTLAQIPTPTEHDGLLWFH